MSHIKILFSHSAFGEEGIESAWAIKVDNGYQLDNILFYAKNFAWQDVVSVEERDGALYVTGLVQENGHSTVRVLLSNAESRPRLIEELETMGCSSEGSNLEVLIAVDIPPTVDYSVVRAYLEKGLSEEKWEYQEACIATNHR